MLIREVKIHLVRLDMKKLGAAAARIARVEGLDAHARALDMRLRDAHHDE